MLTTSGKNGLSRADDRVLIYSALFLVCAAMSAFGMGTVGAMAFLPSAVIIEFAMRCARDAGGDTGHRA